jgi:hypothetical protein
MIFFFLLAPLFKMFSHRCFGTIRHLSFSFNLCFTLISSRKWVSLPCHSKCSGLRRRTKRVEQQDRRRTKEHSRKSTLRPAQWRVKRTRKRGTLNYAFNAGQKGKLLHFFFASLFFPLISSLPSLSLPPQLSSPSDYFHETSRISFLFLR